MPFADRALDFLESQPHWCYHPGSAPASEPTAWSALALSAYGLQGAAARARQWLVDAQAVDGQVGIRQDDSSPGWPTALAILAWSLTDAVAGPRQNVATPSADTHADALPSATERGINWLLSAAGTTSERQEYTGHDTTIVGWPWVLGTHSWVEPTALGLLALRATGHADHQRARDAGRLLNDRLLPAGGCNYGNTVVLGQALLPHVEPTGLALLALGDDPHCAARCESALAYLEATLDADTTSASLAYGLMGLAAHRRALKQSDQWLTACAAKSYRRGSSLELALLALAALGTSCPLIAFSAVHQSASQ